MTTWRGESADGERTAKEPEATGFERQPHERWEKITASDAKTVRQMETHAGIKGLGQAPEFAPAQVVVRRDPEHLDADAIRRKESREVVQVGARAIFPRKRRVAGDDQ